MLWAASATATIGRASLSRPAIRGPEPAPCPASPSTRWVLSAPPIGRAPVARAASASPPSRRHRAHRPDRGFRPAGRRAARERSCGGSGWPCPFPGPEPADPGAPPAAPPCGRAARLDREASRPAPWRRSPRGRARRPAGVPTVAPTDRFADRPARSRMGSRPSARRPPPAARPAGPAAARRVLQEDAWPAQAAAAAPAAEAAARATPRGLARIAMRQALEATATRARQPGPSVHSPPDGFLARCVSGPRERRTDRGGTSA